MPARRRTSPSSTRVSCRPPVSAAAIARLALMHVASSSPDSRFPNAISARTRGAVNRSIQRMSDGTTKCHVGRRTWVRRMLPSAIAPSTSALVSSPARCATAHLAPP